MLSLLEMSASGAVLIVAIIVLRALAMNQLPKKAFLLLWAVALLRLVLPFDVPSPVSVYSVVGQAAFSGQTGSQPSARPGMALTRTGQDLPKTGRNASGMAAVMPPEVMKPAGWPVLAGGWLAGFAALMLYFLVTHLRGRRSYLVSLPVEDDFIKNWLETHRLRRPVRVRYSDQIGAPLTYGILWPVILFPKHMDWEDKETLGYILAHEFSHIRRFDALTKWVLAAVLCLHWFNPLVWAMYVLAGRDLELSCDEAVLKQYGYQSRAAYAFALVGMEERRSCPAPLTSGFSKNALKERITAIMKSRPLTLGSSLAALVLIIAVAVLFATSAQEDADRIVIQEEAALADASGGTRAAPDDSGSEGKKTAGGIDGYEKPVRAGGWPGAEDEEEMDWLDDWEEPEEKLGYTQEEYDKLIKTLAADGYENLSIAAFNRKIHALLSDEEDDGSLSEIYENVLSTMPADDPNADFLCGTVQASLQEYNARVDEVYSGSRVDPEYYASAQRIGDGDVYGDYVSAVTAYVAYGFNYRILDQDRLTVGERDEFLRKILQHVQETLDQQGDAITEPAFMAALEEGGKAFSNDKIEFTDCRIDTLETY